MFLGKEKGKFTFDFYKFIFTVNVYLFDLHDMAFFYILYSSCGKSEGKRNILCNIK